MSTGRRYPLPSPSIARCSTALDNVDQAVEILRSELFVAALRQDTVVSEWASSRLRSMGDAAQQLRDAIAKAPREPQ